LTWRLSGNNISLWNDLHPSGGLFFLVEIDPNTSSLDANDIENELHVFPNPFETEITVELNKEQRFSNINVNSASGVLAISKSFEPTNSINLDVLALPKVLMSFGYFLKMGLLYIVRLYDS
jgi:hypothetical protein